MFRRSLLLILLLIAVSGTPCVAEQLRSTCTITAVDPA